MVESIIGCKWSVRMLWLIADSINRPSALLRACPGLSAKVMNERLRKMMRYGIVQRAVYGEKPPLQVKYKLTPFGRRFMGILKEVRRLQADVENQSISACGNNEDQTDHSQMGRNALPADHVSQAGRPSSQEASNPSPRLCRPSPTGDHEGKKERG
jgi:DNA-binding HxlR family transcriptional regulator